MAQTILADVFFRDELRDYISLPSLERTAFFDSGILVSNSDMMGLLSAPTNTWTIPFWLDIDASIEPNYSNDVYTDIAVPRAVNSSSMQGRTAYLNEGFSAMNLVKNITNQDPLEYVGTRILTFWRRSMQRRLIATALGIYNDNLAGNGGDMIVNANGPLTAAAIIRARATMGDNGPLGGAIAMHSSQYTELQLLNLIDFTPIANQVPEFGRYQGLLVILDDGLPVLDPAAPGGDAQYLSIIFGSGAIGYQEQTPPGEDGLEYDREPARGNGGGVETLWSRRDLLLQPLGYSFLGTTITGNGTETRPQSASWADLALASNWTRVVERKRVPIAFVVATASN
ncbi:hypothetical protein [Pseudomonas veronii]